MLRLEGIRMMMASVSRKGIGPCSSFKRFKILFMPNQQPIVVLFEDRILDPKWPFLFQTVMD